MIKMIVTDMDGTLLNSKKEMPQGMFALIEQLHDHNIRFVAASGRQYFNLYEKFKPIANDMIFIAENGMYMYGYGKEMAVHAMKKQQMRQFISICRSIPDTFYVVCGKKSAYIEQNDKEFRMHVDDYYTKCDLVHDVCEIEDDILKVAVFNLHGTEAHVYPKFKAYTDDFMVSVSAFEWMDIMVKGIHKGTAVKELQKHFSVSYEETMIFGDFMNDYEMMQEGYYSYAMKNAHPEIKKISNLETNDTNEEEGVKKEIERCMKEHMMF